MTLRSRDRLSLFAVVWAQAASSTDTTVRRVSALGADAGLSCGAGPSAPSSLPVRHASFPLTPGPGGPIIPALGLDYSLGAKVKKDIARKAKLPDTDLAKLPSNLNPGLASWARVPLPESKSKKQTR
eukprot:1955077-Rhodomonas_salina.1